MRPTRVAISTDAGRTVLTYLFPYDVDNQVNPEDLVDIEHELDRLECLLADNSQAHVPSPSPPHGIFPSFQSLHKTHLSLSSFEHDTKFSVCVCVVLQAVASVEANRAVVVRGAHAVTVSTATCHPLHRCVLAARPIKSAIAATVTYPPTAIPIILTTATHAQRNYRRPLPRLYTEHRPRSKHTNCARHALFRRIRLHQLARYRCPGGRLPTSVQVRSRKISR